MMNCALLVQKANGVQFLIRTENALLCEICTKFAGLAQHNRLDVGQ